MLKKLPIKNDYLLIIGALLLFVMGYELAFKKTFEAWQTNKELKQKLSSAQGLGGQPDYLERKNSNLDKLIKLYQADTTALRNNLINSVTLLADRQNVKLAEVPAQDASFTSAHFMIEKLDFEGDYFSLLKMSSLLQKQSAIGIIRSENWKVTGIRNNGDKIKKLVLEVYLEISR
ncbi:hypothetical protein SAMN05216490_4783 [Mucilaginibacter mallensis]|uniref:Uncharacterized protein n=1 Tax=Mucilaginibacter mallensis TaxID=652787 RepID=A0A1H2CAD7_MUCMA|nr:hypothetical protein [Mucilaginibacter mallensis]SDT67334.1 hypothetical protein SAMN05216490_4783 [Mucilaginibacter mallensis]